MGKMKRMGVLSGSCIQVFSALHCFCAILQLFKLQKTDKANYS